MIQSEEARLSYTCFTELYRNFQLSEPQNFGSRSLVWAKKKNSKKPLYTTCSATNSRQTQLKTSW